VIIGVPPRWLQKSEWSSVEGNQIPHTTRPLRTPDRPETILKYRFALMQCFRWFGAIYSDPTALVLVLVQVLVLRSKQLLVLVLERVLVLVLTSTSANASTSATSLAFFEHQLVYSKWGWQISCVEHIFSVWAKYGKPNNLQQWVHIHRIWMKWGSTLTGRHAPWSLSWSRGLKKWNACSLDRFSKLDKSWFGV
jgi:hypothetical protein